MYIKICLTMLIVSVLHVASAQSEEKASTNRDAQSNKPDATAEELNVLGVFDRMRLETKNETGETTNKPIIRLASAPESIMERRPWRSIEDPERAGVFPIQPVIINPRFKNSKFTNPEIVLNSNHECDVMHVSAPYLDGDEVAAHFDADCEMPGSEEENEHTKWTVILKLGPDGADPQRTPFFDDGKYADFDVNNAQATLLCSTTGKWKVKAEFRVKVKGDWWGTLIYLNTRSADITCP